MPIDRDHPALEGGMTAPALAIALADARWPDADLVAADGRDLDLDAVRARAGTGSRGERTMAVLVLSLYGDAPALLAELDALDRPSRSLVAEVMALHAGA